MFCPYKQESIAKTKDFVFNYCENNSTEETYKQNFERRQTGEAKQDEQTLGAAGVGSLG